MLYLFYLIQGRCSKIKPRTKRFIDSVNDLKSLKQNADKLMKLVEKDFKLIAWLSWGLEILFQNYSYEKMFDYIAKVSEEELGEYIIETDLKIDDIDNPGVILDTNFELREKGQIVGYFNIENQLDPYPYAEIQARSVFYLCSIVFWQKENDERIDSKHYRLVQPVTGLWIFPESPKYLKNTIDILPSIIPNRKIRTCYNKVYSLWPEEINPDFEIESNLYLYYLGNPLDVYIDSLQCSQIEKKRAYLLLLLDILFGFDTDKDKRLEMLGQYFNLKGDLLKEEVKIVNAIESFGDSRYQEGYGKGYGSGYNSGRSDEREKLTSNLMHTLREQDPSLSEKEAYTKAREMILNDK